MVCSHLVESFGSVLIVSALTAAFSTTVATRQKATFTFNLSPNCLGEQYRVRAECAQEQ
jgi:hypothetical protein